MVWGAITAYYKRFYSANCDMQEMEKLSPLVVHLCGVVFLLLGNQSQKEMSPAKHNYAMIVVITFGFC